jgi:hypothetical protein
MIGTASRIAVATMLAVVLAASAAQAQQAVRVRGTVVAVDGAVLTVKARDGTDQRVRLKDHAQVLGIAKGTVADIKAGSFVGIGAMPLPDGTKRAIRVAIFDETLRGLGEGHRPWERPNGTMTNGTVGQTVKSVDGDVLTVKYKGGEQRIVIPADATVVAYATGDKSEIKPGAHISITRAVKQADGMLEADRINVGRGGVVP